MAPPPLAYQRHRGSGSADGIWWPSIGLSRHAREIPSGGRDQAYPHSNTVAYCDSCTPAHVHAYFSSLLNSHLQPYRDAPYSHLDTSSHACADLASHVHTDSALFTPRFMVALHSAAGGHSSHSGCTPWYDSPGHHAGQLSEQSDHLSRTAALFASCLHHPYTNLVTDPLQTTGGLADIRGAEGRHPVFIGPALQYHRLRHCPGQLSD